MKKNRRFSQLKWWSHPVFRFIVLSGMTLLALVLITSLSKVESFFIQTTSFILSKILSLLQIPYKPSLLDSQFSFQILDGTKLNFLIVPDCTGIYPLSILISFLVGYPVAWNRKWMGLLIAVIATGVVNFIRLTLLIVIGRHSLPAFHLWHTLIWQSSFVLLIAGFYFGWTQWINKKG